MWNRAHGSPRLRRELFTPGLEDQRHGRGLGKERLRPPALAIAAGELFTLALVRDPAPSLTLLRNAEQTLSLSWRSAGALEQTASLTAPNWQPAPSQANPQTNSITDAMKFFRVKAD